MANNAELIKQCEERAQQWLTPAFDEETRKEVQAMLDAEDKSALVDAFYQNLEFGTGGLRGIMGAGTNRMNKYIVGMATQGFANYILKAFPGQEGLSVVVGHDCRNNSRLFAETVAAIFSANGIKAYLFESLRPTPEISFAIRQLGAKAGVNVTASHNPKEYNGYKAYWEDGAQVLAPHDTGIIDEVNKVTIDQVKFEANWDLIKIIGGEMDYDYMTASVPDLKKIPSRTSTTKSMGVKSSLNMMTLYRCGSLYLVFCRSRTDVLSCAMYVYDVCVVA